MKKSVALVAAGALALAACTTDPYTGERKASKAGIGAGVGAAVGALGGATNGNRNLGLDYGSYPNAKSYTVGFNLSF